LQLYFLLIVLFHKKPRQYLSFVSLLTLAPLHL
jgi:hypothetical protein